MPITPEQARAELRRRAQAELARRGVEIPTPQFSPGAGVGGTWEVTPKAGLLSEARRAISRGTIKSVASMYGSVASLMEAGQKQPGKWYPDSPALQESTKQTVASLRGKVRDLYGLTDTDVLRARRGDIPGWVVNVGGEAGAQSLMSAVSYMLGGPPAVVATSAAIGGEEVYQTLREQGVSHEKAEAARWITAPIIGLVEKWQFDEVLKVKNPKLIKEFVSAARERSFHKLAKAGGKVGYNEAVSSVAEGLQETLQEMPAIAAEIATGREADVEADLRRLGTAFVGGAVASEFLRGVSGPLRAPGTISGAITETRRQKDVDVLRRLELSAPRVNEPIAATSPKAAPDAPTAGEQQAQVGQPPVPVGADPKSSTTKTVNEPPLVPVEGTTPDAEAAPIQRSFRNVDLEEARQSAGLPPVVEMDPAGTIQQQYDAAIAEGYGEVDAAVTNARQILEEGRMATDKETYGMSAATEELKRRINASAQAIVNDPVGSESYLRAEEAVDRDTQALDVLTRVGKATGTMWSRIGHARQVVLNDNGDFVSLLARVKRTTGQDIAPEARDRYAKKAAEVQKRREDAARSRRMEVQGRARKHMRKLSKLGKLAKMTEAEKDQQLQDLLDRELTEITLADIAMNLASRESDPTIDRVVRRVREYLPNVSHEQIVDAFDQASRRQTRHTHGMEAVLKNLKRQFRKEKNKLVAIDDVLYWLREGKLPDGTEASLEVDDKVVRDLEEVLQQVKKLQRDSEPWLQRKLQKQIDYLTARLAAKDFTNKRQVQATAPSRATLSLMHRAKLLDRQVGREIAHLKGKQLHWALRGVAEVTRDIQSIKSSYDNSGLLNQGGMIAWAHPIRAAMTLPKALGAAISDKRAFEIEEEIQNRANAPMYSLYGLGLTEASDASQFSQREENFRGILAERIPGVKASNRMFATTLNILRADAFDALVGADAYALGTSHTDLQAAADFVNMASGRGNVRGFESTINAMNGIFWAPRRAISRFQVIATAGGQLEYRFRSKDSKKAGIHLRGSRQFRMAIAGEMARYLMGVSAAMLLAKYGLGADLELDPRSSDFLKLRFGNMRLDPMSGMSQTLVFLTRLNPLILQKKTIDGKVEDLSSYDVEQTLTRFARYKFTPALGIAYSMFRGRTPFDGPWEWNLEGALWTAKEAVVPITFDDVVSAAKDQGIPRAAIANMWGLLGVGVQVYGDNYTPHSDGPRRTYGVRNY